MDGVTVSVLGALVALAVAIVLILKKVQPTYAMIFGAVIGGLVGGAGLTGTVSFIISGTQGIVSAIIRIVTAGILAGALMAFTMSLDDFVISYFVTGSSFITLPVEIYNYTKKPIPPKIYALFTLMFLVILVLMVAMNLLQLRGSKNARHERAHGRARA